MQSEKHKISQRKSIRIHINEFSRKSQSRNWNGGGDSANAKRLCNRLIELYHKAVHAIYRRVSA